MYFQIFVKQVAILVALNTLPASIHISRFSKKLLMQFKGQWGPNKMLHLVSAQQCWQDHFIIHISLDVAMRVKGQLGNVDGERASGKHFLEACQSFNVYLHDVFFQCILSWCVLSMYTFMMCSLNPNLISYHRSLPITTLLKLVWWLSSQGCLSEQHTDLLICHCTKQDLSRTSIDIYKSI